MCSVIHIPALAVLRQLCVSTSTVTPEWVPKTTFVVRRYCSSLHQVLQQKKTEGESSSPPLRMVRMKCKKFINMINFVFRECFSGPFFFYYSALIRWSHQSFSWSTWSAQNVGWCAPLSCRAWAGALSDWSSSTPSTTDSDTEMTPEIEWKESGRGRYRRWQRRRRQISI